MSAPHLRASISSHQDLHLDSSYMGKRLEQQPMYPHYTYYYPHYLQTKVGWSAGLTYFTPFQLGGCLFVTKKKKKNTSALHLVSVSKPSRKPCLTLHLLFSAASLNIKQSLPQLCHAPGSNKGSDVAHLISKKCVFYQAKKRPKRKRLPIGPVVKLLEKSQGCMLK